MKLHGLLTALLVILPTLSASAADPSAGMKTRPALSNVPEGGWVGRFSKMSPKEREALLIRASTLPLAERLLEISEAFLDTPYVVSPLGEGEGFDGDPRFRWDGVDCLTLVEQTLALALTRPDGSALEQQVLSVLDRIRYGRTVSYGQRNHLMEAHWLPSNLAKGFLRNVTPTHGRDAMQRTGKVLTKTTWSSRSSTALSLPVERQAIGSFPLEILPLEAALAASRSIPSGTLMLVVREDLPLKATRITHLGFIVQKRKRTYLRHAARNTFGRVIDEDLATFLTRNAKYTKWRVSGVMLLELTEPPTNVALPE